MRAELHVASYVPRMAVHASSIVLCFASSASVTRSVFPPVVVRSFPLRQRRIQSSSPQPGPSAFRRWDLLPGAVVDTGLEGGGGERVRFAADAATLGSVICLRNGQGLDGAGDVLLFARAKGDGVLISNTGEAMVIGIATTILTTHRTGSTVQAKQSSAFINAML